MTTFKNYTILKSLGKGGQAEVFLAEDNRFQSKVAIKVLNADLALNSHISQRFIAEARNMFRLSHQNIIRVSDLIEEDGRKAFAMEYIEGNNLRDEVEKYGALNQEVILAWMPQILQAMSYCHAEGLVHRDIKPSNFMLTKKGQIKLLDFGIAKNIAGNSEYTQTGTSQMMGTLLYMSPEQILETRNVDLRSDIYSLGVVLWQFATGKKPYDSETLSSFQIQSRIVNEPLPLSGGKFDEIIQKCTAKDLKDRFQSCEEIQEALDCLFKKTEVISESDHTIISPIVDEEKTTIVSTDTLNSRHKRIPSSPPLSEFSKPIPLAKKGNSIFLVVFPFALVVLLVILFSENTSNEFFGDSGDSKDLSVMVEPEMISVNSGSFNMGVIGKDSRQYPVHNVAISSFYMSKFEITQELWKSIMGRNPSEFSDCDQCPVENVSYYDIQEFIKKLNQKTGKSYRLPTEAEWEFAALGGNKTSYNQEKYYYSGSNDINSVAWYFENSQGRTHEVGKKKPNELGLYDMTGNVWEWCLDDLGDYSSEVQIDPIISNEGLSKVLRGGSYNQEVRPSGMLLLKFRVGNTPDSKSADRGFRLALPID